MELISFLSESSTQSRRDAEYAEFFGAAFGRGGLEDTSSSLKTICIIQRDMNDEREANEILRSGSESPADRS